ncbi:unnamed protein product [Parnassius mnemosyne]|uniref:Uncharacterized protein n=1 Tax=Parnassius mnemosyne TaxID=213953 RepID=A0AAV1LGF4_9NEOP
MVIDSIRKSCEEENIFYIAQWWTPNHPDGVDGIGSSAAMCVREIWRLGLIRTIPQSTPRGRCERKCKGMQHLFVVAMNRADRKELGPRRFEPLCAGCGQVEGAGTGEPLPRDGNSIPCEAKSAPCKAAGGVPA